VVEGRNGACWLETVARSYSVPRRGASRRILVQQEHGV